ncbi:MAG: HAD family hydrolase [Candidatus Eiseniibacteriota bacterium]|nr:MAG: HAD family hydrolase [Candidatus Eisenbacteria bacterium]
MSRADWAIFLDRDGTIIEETGYISDPAKVKLLGNVASSIAHLNRLGVPVVVVSNQAGVARGLFTVEDIEAVNERLRQLLAAQDASLDAVYYCVHHPDYDVECDCRKPRPGLLLRAAEELDIDLSRSFMVGDKLTDLQAGKAAGTSTVFVRTGFGSGELEKDGDEVLGFADKVCENSTQAIEWILKQRCGDERTR